MLLNLFILFSASAVGASCLAYALDYYQGDGHILNFYRRYLEGLKTSLKKPLGLCVFCMHYWLYLILTVVLGFVLGIWHEPSFVFVIAYATFFIVFQAISHVILKFLKYYL